MKINVTNIAHKPVTTIPVDADIDFALHLLDDLGFHHLPVVRGDGQCVGMISDRDLLATVGGLETRDRVGNRPGAIAASPRRIREVMSVPAVGLRADEDIAAAIHIMLQKRISAVPILDGGKVAGIVTSRDLLRRFLDDHNAPAGPWRFQKVLAQMQRDLCCLRPTDTLDVAWRLMREKKFRHIPIIRDAKLIGIVSDRDIRRALGTLLVEHAMERGEAPQRIQVGHVMSSDLVSVEPTESLAEAAERMLTHDISALPVLDDEKMIGILTETDLLRALAAACVESPNPVRESMN